MGDLRGDLSDGVVGALRATRPWVRFLSIVSYVGGALILVVGLGMALFGIGGGAIEMGAAALAYLVMGVIYFVGAGLLGTYASRITDLEHSRSISTLEEALSAQKSFWKFAGILTAVILCFYVVILVIALMAGIAMSVR